jgi:hypothetical protein
MAHNNDGNDGGQNLTPVLVVGGLVLVGAGYGLYRMNEYSRELGLKLAEANARERDARNAQLAGLPAASSTSKPSVGTQVVGAAGQLLNAVGGVQGLVSLLKR